MTCHPSYYVGEQEVFFIFLIFFFLIHCLIRRIGEVIITNLIPLNHRRVTNYPSAVHTR